MWIWKKAWICSIKNKHNQIFRPFSKFSVWLTGGYLCCKTRTADWLVKSGPMKKSFYVAIFHFFVLLYLLFESYCLIAKFSSFTYCILSKAASCSVVWHCFSDFHRKLILFDNLFQFKRGLLIYKKLWEEVYFLPEKSYWKLY